MADEDKLREYLNQVTVKLRQTRQRLREARERDSEPVAIVGMSCRFPGGVTDPESLWELLAAGGGVIWGLPAERGWAMGAPHDPGRDQPGKSYVRHGGFMRDVAGFEPGFFGISP